ncbi:MAG: 30S ribosomal protein S20 [Candidatus Omnitrophica bacterium]|nr:30S ribosomal protein S20 [Candidatus Omnitrophota bacterium]
MPVTKQAKKRIRSDAKRRARNTVVLSTLKTLKKKLRNETDPAKAAKLAKELIRNYDRAVSKGIVPKNRADRMKARTSKKHKLA